MPEFVMNDDYECQVQETPFVYGFIEVLFFTETSPAYMSDEWFTEETQEKIREGQSDGNLPGDVGYTDIHPDSLAKIRTFCEDWQTKHAELLERVYAETDYTEDQCGRDFFYVHVGHGVGFSDREALRDRPDLVETLNKAAGDGEVMPYFGDHVTYGNEPFVHVELY